MMLIRSSSVFCCLLSAIFFIPQKKLINGIRHEQWNVKNFKTKHTRPKL